MMETPLHSILILGSIWLLLFLLERFIPLRKTTHALFGRLIINLLISALALVVATLFLQPVVKSLLGWSTNESFGLVHIFSMPAALQFTIAFLLMDLLFYYWHRLNHQIPLLWRFHNVHHTDPDLDVSTAFRFHFGEIALSAVFRTLQITCIGLSAWTYALYELVFQANTLFHHSNLRLPIRLERALNTFLVTPRMHGIHHSQVQRETNSNYSTIFPWWDRLHRTLGLNIPQSEIDIGVPAYTHPNDNTIWQIIILPFCKQRDYWRKPNGEPVTRKKALPNANPYHLSE